MRSLSTIFCLGLLGLYPANSAEVTESYEVTISGQKIIVDSETTTNAVVDGKKLSIRVRELLFKKFDDGNISFMFPARHAVEKKQVAGDTSWTLDGQDNIIMIHRVKDADFAKTVLKELKSEYGQDSKVEDCQCWFGSKKISGQKITAKFAGQKVVQEFFNLPSSSSSSVNYVFVIQDSNETESDETRMVKRKLKETFHMNSAQ